MNLHLLTKTFNFSVLHRPVLWPFQVKVRPTTREVVAMYVVEEITMELVVTLPVNHPLGPISVECGRRVGVANTQWRNWMLQMITFLSHQVNIV